MADWVKAIKKYMKDKHGIHMDELEQKEKPMEDMRKRQGAGMFQADVGEETEEERIKREEEKKKKQKYNY